MAFRPFRRDLTPIGRGGIIRQEGKGGVQTALGNREAITGRNPLAMPTNDYTKPPTMPNRPAPYTGPFTAGRTPPFQTAPTPAGEPIPARPIPRALPGGAVTEGENLPTGDGTTAAGGGTSPVNDTTGGGGGPVGTPGTDDYTA